ncbi:hypothetical protein D9M68_561710 [compost metagenome]
MGAAVARQLGNQLVGRRHQPGLVALAGDLQPPALDALGIAPAEERAHGGGRQLGGAQAAQIKHRQHPAATGRVQAFPRRLGRHCCDRVFDHLPQVVAQIAGDARLGGGAAAAGEGERVAGQVARLGQPGEQRVQDHHRLAHAAGRQWPGKRAPVRMAARELLVSGQHPARGRLRIGEEALVGEQVFVGQRGQRLGQLEHGPQDQPLHLATVGGDCRRAVGIAREPGGHGGQVVARGDAGASGGRAVGAGGASQRR